MNSNTLEVINHIHPLLQTIEEGIEAGKEMLESLQFEECVGMLSDVYLGIQSVQRAFEEIPEVSKEIKENSREIFNGLEKSIATCYSVYNNEVQGPLDEVFYENIIPEYEKWVSIIKTELTLLSQN